MTEEPVSTQVKLARATKDAQSIEWLFGLFFNAPERLPDKDGDSDPSSMESASDAESGDEPSESGSSGESLGSDLDDDEVQTLANSVPAADKLYCHYISKTKKKSSKTRAGTETLEVTCVHFELGGVPRVANSGTVVVPLPPR
jgi:hypothetical protein